MICAAADCVKPVRARGLCGAHYERLRRNGHLHVVPMWERRQRQGRGWKLSTDGYRLVKAPDDPHAQADGWALEHRVVMGRVLGRTLLSNEVPHHKNGDRLDNRPENLELWVRSHPAGQRVEDLVAWAKDILVRYGGGR